MTQRSLVDSNDVDIVQLPNSYYRRLLARYEADHLRPLMRVCSLPAPD